MAHRGAGLEFAINIGSDAAAFRGVKCADIDEFHRFPASGPTENRPLR
ncbi:hypothetical protein Y88_1096 [Novosphingobium nitrogenifigens DSM 19370]|uniref:Uncharacterized protein n=1 Tax=Novosphingobium nitrogenifigens DSM 19370 TaxID=983920 RepID=F1Z8J2_9SPHN|nr:hypothetical protein Y88_1096 [Novosphingobium nitrogenifigens DSM 19370]